VWSIRADAVAAFGFGAIERAVSELQQIVFFRGRSFQQADAEAGGDLALRPGRGFNRVADAFGQGQRAGGIDVRQQYDEFLAARPRDVVFRTHAIAQAGSDLHQRDIAGIGRSWVDEILWEARLSPFKKGSELDTEEMERLHGALHVLGNAIEHYEKTIGPELPDKLPMPLQVHKREGEPCPRCGTPIRRDPFMNRSAYSCPACQPRLRHRARRARSL